jgi:CoA:oxalate CoA-transferase
VQSAAGAHLGQAIGTAQHLCAGRHALRGDPMQHRVMPSQTAQARNRTGALDGLRVLDFSIMLAGPYCTRLLADLGADVIKIEPPEGDDMRLRAPLRPAMDGSAAKHSTYFGQLNAGKRSLALDLKNTEAIALVRRMVQSADVLVENFRPGVMQRLGLGYDELAALNPKLIYCSISGYGQSGPGAERAAYAMMVQAASGFDRSLMRYAGDRERPAPSAVFVADLLGGVNGFAAIQTALVQRARTGLGQRIDVALMDGMLNLLIYEMQEAQFPVANKRPSYGPVRTLDGDVLIAPITQRNFEALCEVTGLAALRDDARFASVPSRGANWKAMMDVVETWTAQRSRTECVRELDAGGVPCSAYADPADALSDEHLRERGVFSDVQDAAGRFIGVNPPWQMSGTATHMRGWVPGVGEHTADVLRDVLQLDAPAVQRLRDAEAFGAALPCPCAPMPPR